MQQGLGWRTAVLVMAIGLGAVSCGVRADGSGARTERDLERCHAQWRDVGESLIGMDQDPNPSALADRWNNVIATVSYYEHVDSAKDCQSRVETQVKAATALRQLSEKLRPYDMTYQLGQIKAAIDLYLNDPLPAPARDDSGRMTQPPSKAAVSSAMKTLTDNAEEANAELQPGWQQISTVDLTDVSTLTTTMQDLDFLAQDSPHWRACEEALQVLVAAVRAQEGQPASPSPSPASTP